MEFVFSEKDVPYGCGKVVVPRDELSRLRRSHHQTGEWAPEARTITANAAGVSVQGPDVVASVMASRYLDRGLPNFSAARNHQPALHLTPAYH
jgi:hypothetical protein